MELARNARLPVPVPRQPSGRIARHCSCPGARKAIGANSQQPWRVWALGRAFGRMQARIHAVRAPALGSASDADWIAWAGPDEPGLQAILRRTASKNCTLLHLDYHPLNVLTDGTQITAVLDWANARSGDARADVARTYTILAVQPLGPGRQPLALGALRHLLARSWRRGYEEVAGPLHGWLRSTHGQGWQ